MTPPVQPPKPDPPRDAPPPAPVPLDNYTLSTVCPACGEETYRLACKVRCPRCGFMWDCSEL
jgi:rRNA maturation protein Nop10